MSRFRYFLETIWLPLPIWRKLDTFVVIAAIYTLGVEIVAHQFVAFLTMPKWIGDMAVVNGLILGVLLSFRNVGAYDRWWEARKLWGQLINDCRNLCLKVATFIDPDRDDRYQFGRLIAGFAIGLKNHLRADGRRLRNIPGFEKELADPEHVPAYFAGRIYAVLAGWRRAGRLGEFDYLTLDTHARALMDMCGSCERIKSSPIPLSYRALLRHGTIVYLGSTTWFLAGEYGYWAVPVVAIMTYFLLGIELTAEDIEDPFDKDGDNLELGRFCETIRQSAEQTLGIDLGLGKIDETQAEIPSL